MENNQIFWDFYKLFDKSLYLDTSRTKKEVEFIQKNLPLNQYKTILDLGCGSGRISIPLSEAGYRVTGVDFDKKAIEEAKSKSNNKNLNFICSDYRTLNINKYFDAVLLVYSSFGYFKDKVNVEILKKVNKMLNKNGVLIIDNLNYYWAVKKKEGFWKDMTSRFDKGYLVGKNISKVERFRQISKDNEFEETTYKVKRIKGKEVMANFKQRIFKKSSLNKILKLSGFEILKTFGNFDSTIYSTETPRIIVISRKI